MEDSIAAQLSRKKKGYLFIAPSSVRAVRACPTFLLGAPPPLRYFSGPTRRAVIVPHPEPPHPELGEGRRMNKKGDHTMGLGAYIHV